MGKRTDLTLNLALAASLVIHGVAALSYDRLRATRRQVANATPTKMGEARIENATPPETKLPTLPPLMEAPPEDEDEVRFGEEGGQGEASSNTQGDRMMEAPRADEMQAFEGQEAYGRDPVLNSPGTGRFNGDGAGGRGRGTPGAASVAAPGREGAAGGSKAPPPPILAQKTVGPSPLPSPFGFQPPPAPLPLPKRKLSSDVIAHGPQDNTATRTPSENQLDPESIDMPSDGVDEAPATAPVAEALASPAATQPAATPTAKPSDSPLATTMPTTGPMDERYAGHISATQPFDPALATTHPSDPSDDTANATFTTQPTTAPNLLVLSYGPPTTLKATTKTAVAEIDPKITPAARAVDGVAEGRVDGLGATTSPVIDAQANETPTPNAVLMASASQSTEGAAPGVPQRLAGQNPGKESQSESDAFSHELVWRDGKVLARDGIKVKSVRPRLTDAEELDLMSLADPRVKIKGIHDASGKVIDAVIEIPSGSNSVNTACLLAAWHWEFFLGNQSGKGQPGKWSIWFEFRRRG